MASAFTPERIEGNLRQQWPNVINDYVKSLNKEINDFYEATRLAAKNLHVHRDTIVNWYSGNSIPDTATFAFVLHKLNKAYEFEEKWGMIILDKKPFKEIGKNYST